MNHVYKTVFNKSTQTWMAVCEYARSVGGGSASGGSKSVTRGVVGSITFLSFAVLMALQSAHANTPITIIADKSADKALQPIVLNTASGVVSVNIATPNARGLSNNHYSQFDVGSTGAVLNNNRKAVNTQIAGFVAANPYMARGEAATILNQVNSNNPSHLNGFIEVAGKKADVIIANPSGLVVNGAGFINAGNVHLAAANSQVNHGQVTGYEVGAGHIAAHGKLNLQGTDYAALIAKTTQINDEIYAGKQLDVILGENSVSLQDGNFNQLSAVHQNNGASSTNQTGTAPTLALDISNLGGMYAGKIHLIGTDKGFGVNNQGVITATGSGQPLGTGTLTLDSQGNLVNTGKILAKDAVTIGTHDNTAQNDGTLLSEQADIAIHTASLNNTGIIHSTQTAKIAAKEAIENRGSVYGGVLQVHTDKLDNTGQLIQTGTGKLDITTDTLINNNKAVIGQSLYGQTDIPTPATPSSDQSASTVSTQPASNTAANTGNANTSTSTGAQGDSSTPNTQAKPTPTANGFITATGSLTNTGDKALITGASDISIDANTTINQDQASIDVQSLATNTLANTDSKIALDTVNWQLSSFDNTKGLLSAKNELMIHSDGNIDNTQGNLASGGVMQLSAVGSLDNTDGVIYGNQDNTITANTITNHKGNIGGSANLSIKVAGQLDNDTGNLSAEGNTTLTIGTNLTNHDGTVFAHNNLTISTQNLTNSGQIYGAQSTTLSASQSLTNTQTGLIASGGDTNITAKSVDNAGSFIAGMNSDGKLDKLANLTVDSQDVFTSTGTHIATKDIKLIGKQLNLTDSHSQAVNIHLDSQTDVSTVNATATATDVLNITAPAELDNTQGQLSAKQIGIDSSKLNNHQGNISQSGTAALTLHFDKGIDNSQGSIIANSDVLSINTGTSTLNNHQGSIEHTGNQFDIRANSINNIQGNLLTIGNQSLIATTTIDNTAGTIQANQLAISTQNLNNSQGNLLSVANQSLTASHTINNTQGVIQADSFTIRANELNNHQGSILATDDTAHNRIHLTGSLSNTQINSSSAAQATIAALGTLDISAKDVVNAGQISTKDLSVDTDTINNTGNISSQQAASIYAKDVLNNSAAGSIYAGTELTLNSQGQINHHGSALAGGNFTASAATLDLTGSTNEADNINYTAQGNIDHNNATSLAAQNIRINNTQGVLSNQAGNLTAKTVDIHTKNLQNGGAITAKDLSITQTDDYTHTNKDKLVANTLTFTTKGEFSNQSDFTATQNLNLTANSIQNHQDATIASTNTALNSQTNITNQGLINGDTTIVKANDTINNQAGGRIYGTHLAIQADTLNNTPVKANDADNHHTAPVIAARERLDIGVNHLNNNPNPDRAKKFNENFDNQALITSLGTLNIGGSLDDNHHAIGKAQTVVNKGATIESGGAMVIGAEVLKNENADFAFRFDQVGDAKTISEFSSGDIVEGDFRDKSKPVHVTHGGWDDDWHKFLIAPTVHTDNFTRTTYTRTDFTPVTDRSDPSLIQAGANLTVNIGQSAYNTNSVVISGETFSAKDNPTDASKYGFVNHASREYAYYHKSNGVLAKYFTYPKKPSWRHSRRPYTQIDTYVIPDEDVAQGQAIALPILNATITTVSSATAIDKSALTSGDIDTVLAALQTNQSALSADAQKQLSDLLAAKQAGQVVDAAVLAALTNELSQTIDDKTATVNTVDTDTLSIPTSAFYTINANDPNQPLIQTDPAFTNYKQWLSSDYMLKALQSDPNHIHKRLSDGYGEQARLKDQYYLLTGRHINTDYSSQEDAYKQLMDNGITHAKQFGYTLGVALTAEQMANLTTDIVWLVKQSITYTSKDQNGKPITTTQDVLVPKLYLRSANIATGTLTADGRYAAISGKSIDMQLTSNLDNNGNIIAQNTANIDADNVNNTAVIQGGFVKINAAKDINNLGGTLSANAAMALNAGNNFTHQSQTVSTQNQQGQSSGGRTDIGQIARITVGDGLKDHKDDNGKPLTTLNIRAGNYILNKAANIQNDGGSTQMTANNGIDITTITTSNNINAVSDSNNYFKYSQTTDVGSTMSSLGDTIITTTGKDADITGKAANIQSGGTTVINATGDVRFSEGRAIQSLNSAISYQEDKWYGSKDITQTHESSSNKAVVSALTGDKVHVSSQTGNVSLFGTNVAAEQQANIAAKQGDVTIQSAVDSTYQNNTKTTQNFYKNTGGIDGSYQESLNQTGIYAGSIDIQGNSTNLNAVKLQAPNGTITVGNAHLATNADGTLKLDDNGKPIVLSGDMQQLNLGVVELNNESWQESSSSYRGFVKDVMKGVGVVAGALGMSDGITLAQSQSSDSTEHTQAVTQVTANQIHLGASQVTAQGSVLDAGVDGTVNILGDDILLTTAKHNQTTTHTTHRQTITGEGMKAGKDHLQLGAVVYTDTTDSQSSEAITHQGVTIRGNSAVVLANMTSGSLTAQATQFKPNELIIGAKSTLLDGAINQSTHTQSNETNTTRLEASVHHVAVDTAVAAENLKEAIEAANDARKALSEAKEMVKAGKLEADAINDYEANLAMATVNVANAQIALGATAATAAATAPTLGFSAKVGAIHTQSQSSQTQTHQDFVATSITAANTTLIGDDFTAKGLQGDIDKLNIDRLNKLTLTHVTTKDTAHSQSSTNTIDASISTSGNLSAGMGRQQSHSQGTSTTAHDTKLILGELNGHANTTTLHGASIITQGGHYSTDTLNITTSQNTHHEQSKSQGGNIGVGTNSLSLGYNQQTSRNDGTTNNTPSGIVYINSHDHSLSANHTTLTGGVIAAINQDEQGNQTNSQINFTTGTLTANDLLATESSQNKGFGVNVGMASKQGNTDVSSIGLSANNSGHNKQTLALATLGQGASVANHQHIDNPALAFVHAGINTDALNTQKVIKDTKTGGLNINTSIDTRVFSQSGRAEIKKEQVGLGQNLESVGKITAAAGVQAVATTGNLLTGNQSLNQIIQGAKAPGKMAKVIQDYPEVGAILDAYQKGEYHNLTLSQEALQALADATGVSTEVLLTSITAEQGIQGGTNKVFTVLDTHDALKEESIQTLGHELDHIRGGKSETLANLAGLATKLSTDTAIATNQDTINPIKVQLGDGTDTSTTAQNQALLNQNNQTFMENHEGKEGEWEYVIPDGAGSGGRGGGVATGMAVGGAVQIISSTRQSTSVSTQQKQQASKQSDIYGPYSPQSTRQDLESVYGTENVKSTTVILNPRQTTTSSQSFQVLRDGHGGKAVRVQYKDPTTGVSKTANIPYDARGLPVFDDISKVTVKIEKPQGYAVLSNEERRRKEMINATLQLKALIEQGKIDKRQFTAQQLTDISRGRMKIRGYTWHHNAQSAPNNMQLIPDEIHNKAVLHTGEGALSEGR